MSVVEWADVVVTGGLGVTGFWIASSIRLRRRAELESAAIERRWDAYKRVWTKTQAAAPMRDLEAGVPLSAPARRETFDAFTDWWFAEGGGMLLGDPTRTIYLTAKRNLTCADADLEPEQIAEHVCQEPDRESARSALAVRQLSLLRTAKRADLGIVASVYGEKLTPPDQAFLRHAGAPLWKRPWWTGRWRDYLTERRAARKRLPASDYRESLPQLVGSHVRSRGQQPQLEDSR